MKNGAKKAIVFSIIVLAVLFSGCSEKIQNSDSSAKNENAGKAELQEVVITSDNLQDGRWEDQITNTEKGDNVSPQLSWDAVDGAACYAIVMIDPDGNNWLHWIETDIRETDIKEGFTTEGEGSGKYIGPYPPEGTHRYDVYVFALRESRVPESIHFDAGGNDPDGILQELTVTEDGRNDNCIGYGMLEGTYESARQEDLSQESAAETQLKDEEQQDMKLKIGDTEIPVSWEKNDSVDALGELIKEGPLTIQMSMYGGFEQVGSIGQAIVRNDQQTTTEPGDIVLYAGDQIVVFYGSNSWAYTRLGHVNLDEGEMTELLGNGDVVITLHGYQVAPSKTDDTAVSREEAQKNMKFNPGDEKGKSIGS